MSASEFDEELWRECLKAIDDAFTIPAWSAAAKAFYTDTRGLRPEYETRRADIQARLAARAVKLADAGNTLAYNHRSANPFRKAVERIWPEHDGWRNTEKWDAYVRRLPGAIPVVDTQAPTRPSSPEPRPAERPVSPIAASAAPTRTTRSTASFLGSVVSGVGTAFTWGASGLAKGGKYVKGAYDERKAKQAAEEAARLAAEEQKRQDEDARWASLTPEEQAAELAVQQAEIDRQAAEAEQKRLASEAAAEQKRAEKERKEEARLLKEQEARRLADEAAEARRLAAAEQKRVEKERKEQEAEAKRLAAIQLAAERNRKSALPVSDMDRLIEAMNALSTDERKKEIDQLLARLAGLSVSKRNSTLGVTIVALLYAIH